MPEYFLANLCWLLPVGVILINSKASATTEVITDFIWELRLLIMAKTAFNLDLVMNAVLTYYSTKNEMGDKPILLVLAKLNHIFAHDV